MTDHAPQPGSGVAASAPPPGPGVAAPFPAPPTEGRNIRVWLGLGAGGLVALLCCGAGTTAVVGLALTATRALNEQAHAVVGDYLDAVRDKEYGQAYDLLCDRAQASESPEQFSRRVAQESSIASYEIGDISITDLTVPVAVTYDTGGADAVRVRLDQDRGTGEFEVCDVER